MLELSEDQLRLLRDNEDAGFVSRIRSQLVAEFPDVNDSGLQQRLQMAHDRALYLGLESAESRTQFLYQEAFAPGFYEQPAIAAWLTRPGAPPEQRWRDFMALASKRIEEA